MTIFIIYPSPPLSFVRSGDVTIPSGSLRDTGNYNCTWSSFAHELSSSIFAKAYDLTFTDLGIRPMNSSDDRWYGFPLRCLAIIIASPPLSFVRSGHVDLYSGSLRAFGLNGYGWSSASRTFTSVTSATAYNLDFNASGVRPSGGPHNRWFGFPIRCQA